MASLQERGGRFRLIFRDHGKPHFVTIGKVSLEEARAKSAQVDDLLLRRKQKRIERPAGVGIAVLHQAAGRWAVCPRRILGSVWEPDGQNRLCLRFVGLAGWRSGWGLARVNLLPPGVRRPDPLSTRPPR